MKDELRKGADRVTERLRQAGYEAYFAGGCVRDQLLGRTPKDYDIVTNARPEHVAGLFRRTLSVGAAFGVIKVLLRKNLDYEVATYRTEGTYSDGRRPDEVVYSDDWREDVARRDLTINALLMDPVTEEILDAVGGRDDLAAGVIRAVGEPARRFEEDKLRMLRAVRFAARFGFGIEVETERAIRASATGLSAVSKERIVTEIEGIVRGRPADGFALMAQMRLLAPALPHLADEGLFVERTGRLDAHAGACALAERYAIVWAASIDTLSRKTAEAALRDLKLSRETIRAALRLYDAQEVLSDCAQPQSASVMRLAAASDAALLAAYQGVMFGEVAAAERFSSARQDVNARPLPPRPIVSGGDLQALGLKPGRHFKTILDAVDDAVLERRVIDRAQALAFVERLRQESSS